MNEKDIERAVEQGILNAMLGPPKNKWIALILCGLLGFFGAHKFYEGKLGTGLLYLFTCGGCGFLWMIDFIILLFKPTHYYTY